MVICIKKRKFYITTSIMYTNAKPHIGFALELIQADALARAHRLNGDDVFFLTGTDEHGVKIQKAAMDAKKDPHKFVDEIAMQVQELASVLKISNDSFIRTTDKEVHWPAVEKIWEMLEENGDLYRKNYTGYYCVGCEAFKTDRELVNGVCPIHEKKPELVDEDNFFFKLSKYQKKLIELIESDKFKIVPKERKTEIINFIKSGLEDVSFSRSRKALAWGIPVPGSNDQTMYVWCDALVNYLSGIGYSSDEKKFGKYWPADVHIIGKDILRFHAVFWPAMLLSAGIELPKVIFVHGFMTAQGKKMSKSLGNVVYPIDYVKKYSSDALRYYLFRDIPSSNDGDFNESVMIQRINANLAGDLGNLVYRVLTMAEKSFEGKVPAPSKDSLSKIAADLHKKVMIDIDEYNFQGALDEIWKLVTESNKYINVKEPWKIKDKKELGKVIYELLESLRVIAILINPFMPEASEKILEQLGLDKNISFKDLKWGGLKKGTVVKKGKIMFNKVEV